MMNNEEQKQQQQRREDLIRVQSYWSYGSTINNNNKKFKGPFQDYFTEYTLTKGLFYTVMIVYVIAVCIIVVLELFLSNELICNTNNIPAQMLQAQKYTYNNPSYIYEPCDHMRLPLLLYLTRLECSFGRRLVASVILGGLIGWERRQADRPAGIRTMSLVSLGTCLFSIDSAFAFLDGSMGWDASRVSAAIPSGVGFLGAGLIFKEAQKDKLTGHTAHVVHGLTTATSLWISAAIGVACAGQLYFAASFSVAGILVLLRFGPRQRNNDDDDDEKSATFGNFPFPNKNNDDNEDPPDPELQPLNDNKGNKNINSSVRKRAHLGGLV